MKVTVKAKQVIEYNQDVEMTEEDFVNLKDIRMDDISIDSDPQLYFMLERYIDPSVIFCSDEEFKEVSVEKAK